MRLLIITDNTWTVSIGICGHIYLWVQLISGGKRMMIRVDSLASDADTLYSDVKRNATRPV